ncbi:hypothetical protein AXX17_AT1G32680 [Arabidopsis thaliana]|uniref:Uncharacterized protein n=1 Tax=Arabidopsis thaliana TaxID=3702 RepID=A0A178WGA0_ARATH|nr:hypothetical protein AXX17_AT1G32680 [Arabidopsis thaliana]
MTDGKVFDLDHGESASIYAYITADIYTKFERNFADVQGYLLKYDDYNIMLNDYLGKSNGVRDNAIHTWKGSECVNINIHPDEMTIWCTANDLGIYQSDGHSKFYRSVIATHNKDGGISVRGFETVAGERMEHTPDVQKKEAEDEGQSKD